ncbi:MAG TPA: helix-turn-helix domain-containing protein [Mycobacteriales bacterium]
MSTTQPDPRWAELPPSLAPVLSGALDGVADEMIALLRAEVPLYQRPLEGSFGAGIRLGVTEALRQFTLLVETAGAGETGGLGVYEELGRGELRQGRPLDALLAAYRIGARFAWRRFATLAVDHGLDKDQLITLAELVFDHIDELSAASARGYAEQQNLMAGERDRARQALLRMLLAPAVDHESALAASRLASWRLPSRLLVVVAPDGAPVASRLGEGALIRGGDPLVAIVGDPPPGLLRSLDGTGAVLGPVRDVGGGAVSRDRALALLALRDQLGLPQDAAISTDDHLLSLILYADPLAAQDFAASVLAPLDALAPSTRDRLLETLSAWLRHAGERANAAEALHIHPQTVRYRLGRLRELLGDVVDDPDQRLSLMVALRLRGV